MIGITDRERLLIEAAHKFGLYDDGSGYYKLGGHGDVLVRYNARTLPALEKRGLLRRDKSVWKATDAGVKHIQVDGETVA